VFLFFPVIAVFALLLQYRRYLHFEQSLFSIIFASEILLINKLLLL